MDMPTPNSSSIDTLLRRLAVAAWGACCGTFIAIAITAALILIRGDTYDRPHPDLLSSEYLKHFEDVPWQERYERTWYFLTCVLGALGGWLATRYLRERVVDTSGNHCLRPGGGMDLSRRVQGADAPGPLPGHGRDPVIPAPASIPASVIAAGSQR
jgi:hypothetical protein